MKKRINLLSKKRSEIIEPVVSDRVNLYGTITGVILFIVFIVYIVLFLQIQSKKAALAAEKDNLYTFVITNKDEIAKMNFYSHKNEQLKTFLKDDAEFLPYYNLLKEALAAVASTNSQPQLDYMKIDKNKNTDFTVRFDSYEPAFEFLKSMETESFLSNFIELKLIGFSVNETIAADKPGYELQFQGKFKPIYGTSSNLE